MINRLGLVLLPTLALFACTAGTSGDLASKESTRATSAALTAPLKKVPQSPNPYTLFETLQVRPLALSRDGQTLYALNTPDNRLEIFKIAGDRIRPAGSVTVGLEPVAVAVRSDDEVWVVNHLSDSVSIVRVGDDWEGGAQVVRTLLVGDEPRDIVFAGKHHERAFVTTAHRGQNSPDDADLFANVGRADVWVFDADDLGTAPGGTRLAKLSFFADTPRALAATPDGKTVYAAAFFSGNQTTTVAEGAVATVFTNGMPGVPYIIVGGQVVPQPTTGLIVKYKGGHWLDAYGNAWDTAVKVSLPDEDVFAIDATANPPAAVSSGVYAHVGTTLFNMAVNPKSGKLYVSNTDAHNDVRFEGHTPGFTSVRGNIVDSRITVIDPATSSVTADNLNPHLDHVAGTGDASLSVAFPQDLTFSRDGSKVYVVAQGSSKLAIYDTAALESGTATPSATNQIALTGGGPTGVVTKDHLAFVLTRFDNSISVVNLESRKETSHHAMFSPEPASVTAGRQFLYNATLTSALGDQACSSCHIGGDFDGLAWDLGNPGAFPLPITDLAAQESDIHTIPEAPLAALFGVPQITYLFAAYQPAKGPMTTQSLRGMDNHGAMHWRGDRNGAVQQTGLPFLSGGSPVVSAQPNAGIFDELNAFKSFNVAFPGLVGDAAELSDSDMTDYANFALQITYPPNPIRSLDDSLTPAEQAGEAFFFNNAGGQELPSDRFHNCNGCHTLDRNGNAGVSPHPGFFGSSGRLSFENETQIFKVPHLRNMYQKIGMYASSLDQTHAAASVFPPLNPPAAGVRGFGFQHDGATATIEHFLSGVVFIQATVPVTFGGVNAPPNPFGIPLFADPTSPFDFTKGVSASGLATRRELASFLFAFDSNLRPVVGQQATLTASNGAALASRLALFESQAALGNTDLVVHAHILGRDAGFVYSNGSFLADVSWVPPLTDAQLRDLLGFATNALTFTCVPPGSGFRIGIDRDGDGYADGDEVLRGSDPADPSSTL
jgi:DNA-binding beta-propeller fold protein YncE